MFSVPSDPLFACSWTTFLEKHVWKPRGYGHRLVIQRHCLYAELCNSTNTYGAAPMNPRWLHTETKHVLLDRLPASLETRSNIQQSPHWDVIEWRRTKLCDPLQI